MNKDDIICHFGNRWVASLNVDTKEAEMKMTIDR